MDSREQFQQWWEKFYEDEPREPWSVLYSPEYDYYLDEDIDEQYDAWKASRAALVFEFPNYECAGTPQSDSWNDCLERCENAVKSEGISVKESAAQYICPHCGGKGWSANCEKCIPY